MSDQIKNWCSVFFVAGCLCSSGVSKAAELMGAAQEAAVVHKHCGSVYSDALGVAGYRSNTLTLLDPIQPSPPCC